MKEQLSVGFIYICDVIYWKLHSVVRFANSKTSPKTIILFDRVWRGLPWKICLNKHLTNSRKNWVSAWVIFWGLKSNLTIFQSTNYNAKRHARKWRAPLLKTEVWPDQELISIAPESEVLPAVWASTNKLRNYTLIGSDCWHVVHFLCLYSWYLFYFSQTCARWEGGMWTSTGGSLQTAVPSPTTWECRSCS